MSLPVALRLDCQFASNRDPSIASNNGSDADLVMSRLCRADYASLE